jgi:hypothetical protein
MKNCNIIANTESSCLKARAFRQMSSGLEARKAWRRIGIGTAAALAFFYRWRICCYDGKEYAF